MWLNYGVHILQSGIRCVKLDGSMTMQARDQMIDRFTNDPDCKVILKTEFHYNVLTWRVEVVKELSILAVTCYRRSGLGGYLSCWRPDFFPGHVLYSYRLNKPWTIYKVAWLLTSNLLYEYKDTYAWDNLYILWLQVYLTSCNWIHTELCFWTCPL